MHYKIGVYGSTTKGSKEAVYLAEELGTQLARNQVIVITGACNGMPYVVASAAKRAGAEVWGFSPEYDEAGQKRAYPHDDITTYDRLFYVPRDYHQRFFLDKNLPPPLDRSARLKYRNVISTIHADAGIIVSGGWGSMNEFTNLIYDSKPIGVLRGTGGLADELPQWFYRLPQKSESHVILSDNPSELVSLLLRELQQLTD